MEGSARSECPPVSGSASFHEGLTEPVGKEKDSRVVKDSIDSGPNRAGLQWNLAGMTAAPSRTATKTGSRFDRWWRPFRRISRVLTLIALMVPADLRPQAADAAGSEAIVRAHLEAAKRAEARQDHLAAADEYKAILALRPDWALIHQSLGVTYHLAKRFPLSIEHLLEAVRLDEELWGAFLFLGMDYYQLHRFGDAIEALDKSLALNPGLAETRRWLGLSNWALGQYEEAIIHLSKASGQNNDDEEALFHLSRAYDRRAAQLFESIGQSEPESAFVYLLQAERFLAEGDLERARADYVRAVAIRPDLAGTLDALAPAEPVPGPADPEFKQIRAAFAAGQYSDTSAEAKRMLVARPENLEARYWLGRSYKSLAAQTVDRLTAVAPDSYRVDQLAAEFHRGRTAYGKALEAYRRALGKRPELPGLRYAIGSVYWEMRRLEEAETWLRQELERNPHHALAGHRLGSLLLERGEAREAIPLLLQAVQTMPDSADARFDLGRAYLADSHYEAAASQLEAYARLESGNDRAHYLLASAYRALGRLDDAQRELKRYQDARRQRLRQVQQDVKSVANDLKRDPR